MLFISRPSRDKVASANVMSPVPSGAFRDHGMLVGMFSLLPIIWWRIETQHVSITTALNWHWVHAACL